jgi:hypothetical protein
MRLSIFGLRMRPQGTLPLQLKHGEKTMSLVFKKISSPVGKLTLVASDKGLVAVLWENDKPTSNNTSLGSAKICNAHAPAGDRIDRSEIRCC